MVKDLVSGKEWKEPLRLDLGCGPWIREGFIGIDIRNFWEGNKIKDYEVKADIFYDLNKGIPFPDNSIDQINMGHFLEHVANPYNMLDECIRVLQPNGVIDIVVPLNEIYSPDHITSFYSEWFDRNIHLAGAYFKGRLWIVSKEISLENLKEEQRAIWILKIRLGVVK